MTKKYNENVLVFHADILSAVNQRPIHGLAFQANDYLDAICDERNASRVKMLDRNVAETCELWKQLIPYIVVRHTTESGESKYLVYRRGKSGGENRLHDKYSIGVGGHINDLDLTQYNDGQLDVVMTIIENIKRELREEVRLPLTLNAQPLAVIYDNSNAVGRVHFGIVFIFDTNADTALAVEDCIEKPEFLSVEELKNLNLENWSRLVVDRLL